MPSFNPKRFADPKAIQSVSPEVLREFLAPHKEFIESKGFPLGEKSSLSDFDYLMLTAILMTPDERMSSELIDAIHYVHEVSTESLMDSLLRTARDIGLDIPEESTPMDIAMRIWIADREGLERVHSERLIHKTRTFEHYVADRPLPFGGASDEAIAAMESVLDEWFTSRKRGGSSSVFIFPSESEVWFIVRHGDSFRRDMAVYGYESRPIFYRPEAFDVACYHQLTGELRVHARTKGDLTIYRREIGRLVSGDSEHFPTVEKYSLSPLAEDGENCLVTSDILGIDWIMLTEVKFQVQRTFCKYWVTYAAENVFAVMRMYGDTERWNDTILRAKFAVRFTGESRPRSFAVTPPNRVQLGRDHDSALIEEWLRARGFVISEVSEGEDTSDLLASG